MFAGVSLRIRNQVFSYLSMKTCKAYREGQTHNEHLLAGLAVELPTAIKDVALKVILFTLTLFERSQSWRKLTQHSVNSL